MDIKGKKAIVFGGTSGIGLATCAELIAQHGWTIHAFGAPDEGAEFRISVPWKDVVQLREPKADAVD